MAEFSRILSILILCFLVNAVTWAQETAEFRPPSTDNNPAKIKIISAVADDGFIKLIVQNFAEKNPDCKVNITACAQTQEALKRIDNGTADLAIVQLAATTRKPVYGVIKPFAVIVNSANQLDNISLPRLTKVFSGETTLWSELGGAKVPIKVITFPIDSSLQTTLCRLLEIPKIAARNQVNENGERAIIALTAYEVNTIACVPVEYVNDNVKILKVNGNMPDRGSIEAGKYPLVARFLVLQSPRHSPDTAELIKLMHSKIGEDTCRYLSLLPLKVE